MSDMHMGCLSISLFFSKCREGVEGSDDEATILNHGGHAVSR